MNTSTWLSTRSAGRKRQWLRKVVRRSALVASHSRLLHSTRSVSARAFTLSRVSVPVPSCPLYSHHLLLPHVPSTALRFGRRVPVRLMSSDIKEKTMPRPAHTPATVSHTHVHVYVDVDVSVHEHVTRHVSVRVRQCPLSHPSFGVIDRRHPTSPSVPESAAPFLLFQPHDHIPNGMIRASTG